MDTSLKRTGPEYPALPAAWRRTTCAELVSESCRPDRSSIGSQMPISLERVAAERTGVAGSRLPERPGAQRERRRLSMWRMPDDPPVPAAEHASGWAEDLPFALGDCGAGVADLQQRLDQLGYSVEADSKGVFGEATRRAVELFQAARGLPVEGVCGPYTWSSLVEAGFQLGDRLLYRRSPMLHGDDVAALQRRLSILGFDPGRVDGIFGDNTATALADFQHNIGIASDGICGPRTLGELSRLSTRRGGEDLVTPVREKLRLRDAGTLQGRTIAVGEQGGFQVGTAALVRSLTAAGARCVTIHHPDEAEHAAQANTASADCYVGLRLEPACRGVRTIYYHGYRYESEASRHLAELICGHTAEALELAVDGIDGMALPVLRRTRMPAVVVELGSPTLVTMKVADLASAISESLTEWLEKEWV